MAHNKERVLEYIKQNGSITSLEAIYELGVTRLSDVIFRLDKEGYEFERETEKGKNRFGEKTHFTRYRLKN